MNTQQLELNFNQPQPSKLEQDLGKYLNTKVTKVEQWVHVLWVHVSGHRPTFISLKKFMEFVKAMTVQQKTKLEDFLVNLENTGTEKQVNWAISIREASLKYVKTALTNALKKGKFDFVTKKEINTIILRTFNKYKTATEWIDGRYEMGSALWDKVVMQINQLPTLKRNNLI